MRQPIVIIPNAVSVDIGCGMAFVGTHIPVGEESRFAYKDIENLRDCVRSVNRLKKVGVVKG